MRKFAPPQHSHSPNAPAKESLLLFGLFGCLGPVLTRKKVNTRRFRSVRARLHDLDSMCVHTRTHTHSPHLSFDRWRNEKLNLLQHNPNPPFRCDRNGNTREKRIALGTSIKKVEQPSEGGWWRVLLCIGVCCPIDPMPQRSRSKRMHTQIHV